jgi:hypothetical protein
MHRAQPHAIYSELRSYNAATVDGFYTVLEIFNNYARSFSLIRLLYKVIFKTANRFHEECFLYVYIVYSKLANIYCDLMQTVKLSCYMCCMPIVFFLSRHLLYMSAQDVYVRHIMQTPI